MTTPIASLSMGLSVSPARRLLRSRLLELSVLMLGVFGTAALAAINLPGPGPDRAAPFAVMFPPWISPAEAAMASWSAGLRVIRTGALPFVVVVAGGEDTDFVSKPATALLAIRLGGLTGCGVRDAGELAR